jgi:hypothetical protein
VYTSVTAKSSRVSELSVAVFAGERLPFYMSLQDDRSANERGPRQQRGDRKERKPYSQMAFEGELCGENFEALGPCTFVHFRSF